MSLNENILTCIKCGIIVYSDGTTINNGKFYKDKGGFKSYCGSCFAGLPSPIKLKLLKNKIYKKETKEFLGTFGIRSIKLLFPARYRTLIKESKNEQKWRIKNSNLYLCLS